MASNVTTVGLMPNGAEIKSVLLTGHGLKANVMTFGASLASLHMDGIGHSLVLGLPSAADYLNQRMYFGANVGRFANRISNARFELDGNQYALDRNFLGAHILHGGVDGSGSRNWMLVDANEYSARFEDLLPDGHMGFPGNLKVSLTYSLEEEAKLTLRFEAQCDAPTVCNFAHHSYFNLSGDPDIRDHHLYISAPAYLEVDDALIPTGNKLDVTATPFDFQSIRRLGDTIEHHLLDHNFCLSGDQSAEREVARLLAPDQTLEMSVSSTEPGLQVYDGSALGEFRLEDGQRPFQRHGGLALEPQGWPDAPNQASFPSSALLPGDTYLQQTSFRFHKAG